ncbi:hypothetical protein [Pseudalkalibacillus hwajinpoensis]|uniref:hypothetical protein n=1 Tax=Guptibacillus hwajinpoensis TaxID=208199 RepID=UPI001CD57CE9|nr:hypothetical protein [Pseudalkalibacillus hwajinpoensis]MCA0992087.1 hypothetical protein [Pseudalkalibacillus hwajinpoensis]
MKNGFYNGVAMIGSFFLFCAGLTSLFGWTILSSTKLSAIIAVTGFLGVLTNSWQLKKYMKQSRSYNS